MFYLFFLFLATSIFCATPEDVEVFKGGVATWHMVDSSLARSQTDSPGLHIFCVRPENPHTFMTLDDIAVIEYNTLTKEKAMPPVFIFGEYAWEDGTNPFKKTMDNISRLAVQIHSDFYRLSYNAPIPSKADYIDLTLTTSPPSTEIMRYAFHHRKKEDPILTITITASNHDPCAIKICTNNHASCKGSPLYGMFPYQRAIFNPLQAHQGAHASWLPLSEYFTQDPNPKKLFQELLDFTERLGLTGTIIAYCPQTLGISWENNLTRNIACIFSTNTNKHVWFQAKAHKSSVKTQSPELTITIEQIDSCGSEDFTKQTFSNPATSICGFSGPGLKNYMSEEYAICPLPSASNKDCLEISCNAIGACIIAWSSGHIHSMTPIDFPQTTRLCGIL